MARGGRADDQTLSAGRTKEGEMRPCCSMPTTRLLRNARVLRLPRPKRPPAFFSLRLMRGPLCSFNPPSSLQTYQTNRIKPNQTQAYANLG